LKSKSYILGITNFVDYGKTEGGTPIMAASGQAVNEYDSDSEQQKDSGIDIEMVLPKELSYGKNIPNESMDYLMALFAL
jgi:hypothetical protein